MVQRTEDNEEMYKNWGVLVKMLMCFELRDKGNVSCEMFGVNKVMLHTRGTRNPWKLILN